ncbi:MAG TPA: hypothetical protein VFR60_05230 [Sphingomicrobium sp.]|nr:hypothetical protein [Sphingomicrobium sp.]
MAHAEVGEANEASLRNKPTVPKLWLQAKFPSTVLDVGCGGAASDPEAGEVGDRTGQMAPGTGRLVHEDQLAFARGAVIRLFLT